MQAFILGSSGQLGYAVGRRLLEAGWEVTCGQRGDALLELRELGAKSVCVDRNEAGALRAAIADGADALIDAIAFDAEHAEQLLEVQDAVGQFVVISSASVYRDHLGRTLDEATTMEELPEMPVPISESQPTVEPGSQTYSTKKLALETAMLDRGRVPVSIIRPCAIYGPHSKHPREWYFVKRWLDGRRRVPLKFEDAIFQTSATTNIAEVIYVALKGTFRGVLNAGDPDAPSVRAIADTIAKTLAWDCEFITVAPEEDDVGTTPWSGLHPFVLSMEAAQELGYEPWTSYAGFSPEMCRWLIEAARDHDWRDVFPVLKLYPDLFNYAAEDAFLATREK